MAVPFFLLALLVFSWARAEHVEQSNLLASPDRGHRQVLVDAWQEVDVVLFSEPLRLPQRLVYATQG